MKRGVWGTRLGFYMAAIGAAFGLGSLWRFPYIVQENGGGAFVFVYFVVLVLIGIPMLVGELLIGRITRRSAISAMKQISAQQAASKAPPMFYRHTRLIIGVLSLVVCIFIIGYYSVVSGWVLHYLIHFATMPFFDMSGTTPTLMSGLRDRGWLQVLLASVHLVLVTIIVAKDFEEGLERFIGYVMPVFVLALLFLLYQVSHLESLEPAVQFFFYPDFSKLSLNSLGAAVGHVCFTLSIGFGAMITFGSYLKEEARVPSTGFRVAIMDSLMTIIAGLLIFPLLFSSPIKASGPELLFQTVPVFFVESDGGKIFGLLFFICLYLAALGASLSLIETVTANFVDAFKINRAKAGWLAGGLCFLTTLPPALGTSLLKNMTVNNMSLLELIDSVLVNWFLPLIALAMSFIARRRLNEKVRREEFIIQDDSTSEIIYFHWLFLMKWVVPFVLILGLILQVIALVR
ncbi:MAG: sodium-dependent transporter [Bdellovibrionota bacterium]